MLQLKGRCLKKVIQEVADTWFHLTRERNRSRSLHLTKERVHENGKQGAGGCERYYEGMVIKICFLTKCYNEKN